MSTLILRLGHCRRYMTTSLQYNIYCHNYLLQQPGHNHSRRILLLAASTNDTTAIGSPDPLRRHERGLVPLSPHRHLQIPIPFKRTQNNRAMDQMPMTHELVYHSPSALYISYFYPMSMLGVFSSTCLCAYGYFTDAQVNIYDDTFHVFDSMMDAVVAVSCMGAIAYLALIIARRSPLRIYYNPDDETFVATFATMLLWKVRKLEFGAGQLRELYTHLKEDENDPLFVAIGIMTTFRGRYVLGKRRLAVVPHYFKYPHYYNVMMGYVLQNDNPKDDEPS